MLPDITADRPAQIHHDEASDHENVFYGTAASAECVQTPPASEPLFWVFLLLNSAWDYIGYPHRVLEEQHFCYYGTSILTSCGNVQ